MVRTIKAVFKFKAQHIKGKQFFLKIKCGQFNYIKTVMKLTPHHARHNSNITCILSDFLFINNCKIIDRESRPLVFIAVQRIACDTQIET